MDRHYNRKLHGDDSTGSASSSTTLTTATPPTPTTASSESPHPVPVVRSRKPTARKSTSQSGIRVAMLRCGDFFSIRQCAAVDEGSPAASGTSTEASVDSGISQSDSTEHLSQLQVLCCHLCSFTSQSLSSFANHLQVLHQWSLSRRIEILDPDDPDTPRRCGFCPYETFSDPDFSDHVSAVHGMSPPVFRLSEIRLVRSPWNPWALCQQSSELCFGRVWAAVGAIFHVLWLTVVKVHRPSRSWWLVHPESTGSREWYCGHVTRGVQ